MIKEAAIAEESFLKRGRMKKSPLEMSPEELKSWEEQEALYVRNYLFSIGQPLVYGKNGEWVIEYSDGRIEKSNFAENLSHENF